MRDQCVEKPQSYGPNHATRYCGDTKILVVHDYVGLQLPRDVDKPTAYAAAAAGAAGGDDDDDDDAVTSC